MSPLDRKLLRDLWTSRGQATSIALVVAFGVALLVMMHGLVNSLEETRRAYYERYRLADVFAPLKRAPRPALLSLEQLAGVDTVVGRISGGALIDLDAESAPVRAQVISLPDFGRSPLNELHLTRGRRPDAARPQEAVLLDGFAQARSIALGDELATTIYGVRQRLSIVGFAQAPEFVTTMAPGELAPDDARFAVLWLGRNALEAAYDMDGAFNEALIKLRRGASEREVVAAVDRLLEPHGGFGAYPLAEQLSNRFVSEEIRGLRASSTSVPPVFLAVAAFLLYVVMARMLQTEREQIGLLKSFGYSSIEVGWHYAKFVLAIATLGAFIGCMLGITMGRAMAELYQQYFKFPFLVFTVPPQVMIFGLLVSVLAASIGGLLVVRRVFGLSPAVAMRPPAPPRFARSSRWLQGLLDRFDQPSRMILRQLLRQPGRTGLAVTGIATGMALSVAMLAMMHGFERMVELNFSVVDRSDLTVTFIEPRGERVVHELRRLRGVHEAEPVRAVAVRFRHGTQSYLGSINGFLSEPELQRALDADLQPLFIRGEGLILSRPLAKELAVDAGDRVVIEVREGRRPVLELPVLAVARTLLGAPAYLELNALNRALNEDRRVSGVYLTIDAAETERLYEQIKDMPAVAGVSLKADARDAIVRVMNEGAGATRHVMAVIAGLITFGIIYTSARIAFAERSRDLSSLRVFGFSRAETAFVLLGELVLLTVVALPVGMIGGQAFAEVIAEAFSTDLYQVPAAVPLSAHANAAIAVLLATAASALIVKRDLDRLDIVHALKSRD
ncbi:MAG: ABC transporter permease [Pseudomonadota bacterium]